MRGQGRALLAGGAWEQRIGISYVGARRENVNPADAAHPFPIKYYLVAILFIVFDVEVAGLAEDEGDSIGELLVIAERDDVDVPCGRERPRGRVGQCGQDRGGADDVKVVKIEALADLQDHVLQLMPLHEESRSPD